MNPVQRLLKHSARFSAGSLLALLASLFAFPFLTRMLTVEEYGLLSFVAAAVTMAVSLGKLGFQHSMLRYHSRYCREADSDEARMFGSTTFIGLTTLALLAALLFALVSYLMPAAASNANRWLIVASPLVALTILESIFVNQLRAQERSGALTIYQTSRKYGDLAALFLVLGLIEKSLLGFYSAMIGSAVLGVLMLGIYMRRDIQPRLRDFSWALFRTLLMFGIPMLGYELLTVSVLLSDRYLIKTILGAADLGIYSAAYNLSDAIQAAFVASVAGAVMPIYLKAYNEKGREETEHIIGQFLRLYVFVTAGLCAMLWSIGPELVEVMASQKFRAAGELLPVLLLAAAVQGAVAILGAGLYVANRTQLFMIVALVVLVIRVALMYVGLRYWGILGAALISLACASLTALVVLVLGRRNLTIRMPWALLLKLSALSLMLILSLRHVDAGGVFTTLLVRGSAGALAFCVGAVLLDAGLRAKAFGLVNRVRQRR